MVSEKSNKLQTEKKLSNEEGLKNEQNFRSNRGKQTPFFTVFLKSGNNSIVCVISKKVAKKAVDRNRMRRLIKESLKEQIINSKIVVVVKKNFADEKMESIREALLPFLKKND